MKLKDINSLAQLRAAKAELKLKMKRTDEKAKNSFVYSTINKLFGSKSDSASHSAVLDSGTFDAIQFLGSQNKSGLAKPILSTIVAIAVPILARFAVKWLKKKLNIS